MKCFECGDEMKKFGENEFFCSNCKVETRLSKTWSRTFTPEGENVDVYIDHESQ